MTCIYKKDVLDLDKYCSRVIAQLEAEQERDDNNILFGNYTSSRYHRFLPIRRSEDNVYFVSWINQLLLRNINQLPIDLIERARLLIDNGERSIARYGNRYGESTYNFYRPKAWFPNGRLLSRFGIFQPTDDSDDTSIAYRGRRHARHNAAEVKEILIKHSNGKSDRWLKRIPKEYREIKCYSTWIGSDQIYVDTDIVVLSNILMFNAHYGLSQCEEDSASLLLIRKAVLSGDYLTQKWSLSSWYPFESVILYSLADLVSLDYYDDLTEVKDRLTLDLHNAKVEDDDPIERLLIDSALMKLGHSARFEDDLDSIESSVGSSSGFSFGVIPLLHPWNGVIMQYLSSFSLFRLYYDCRAQRSAILLENLLLRKSRISQHTEEKKRRARSYKPDSVILNK